MTTTTANSSFEISFARMRIVSYDIDEKVVIAVFGKVECFVIKTDGDDCGCLELATLSAAVQRLV